MNNINITRNYLNENKNLNQNKRNQKNYISDDNTV